MEGGEGEGGGEDITQVALRPDAGALVEQITYLTSWPQTTPPDTANSVEIITQPSVPHSTGQQVVPTATPTNTSRDDDSIMSQTLREHYSGVLTEGSGEQMSEEQLQVALQHITTYR